ncbi:MAG: gliding motility-associated C-terminal domain-containing protein [Saprospiraceae bacterium]|nr:gliding motility-associated C-terminal domain-containing protein [Saprospiraceae bacterium]
MWRKIPSLLSLFFCWYGTLVGQSPSDCAGAIVICSDGPVAFNPSSIDFDDYSNTDNDPGCLLTFENQSVWYYFEFREDMPPNSIIEFLINPNGGFGEDYDFAIYGPNVACDSLGEPIRCSFANFLCTECPFTGLGNGATDTSEGAEGEDGFVAPMMVQPGQGFFMILDNWYGSSTGFELTWGGSAAPYLNCLADPACSNFSVIGGTDLQLCAMDTSLTLSASTTGFGPGTVYSWTSVNGLDALLDDTQVLNPTLQLSDTLSGNYMLRITAQRNNCIETDTIAVAITPAPAIVISGDTIACLNSTVTLNAGPGYTDYQWSNDSTSQSISVLAGLSYSVTITDANGCRNSDSILVSTYAVADPVIQGSAQLCENSSSTLSAPPGFVAWSWSTGINDSTIVISSAADYRLTVTDANGCQYADTLAVTVAPLPQPAISGSLTFCENGQTTIDAGPGFAGYSWTGGTNLAQLQVDLPGLYAVTVTDANGCQGADTVDVATWPLPAPQIDGALTYCADGSTSLSVNGSFQSYLWSTSETSSAIVFSGTGQVGVTVSDANGCQGQANVNITQLSLPQINLADNAAFCPGGSTQLDAGPGFSVYQWTGGLPQQAITVNTPGTYSVTVTDANGCSTTDSTAVSELAAPVVQITGPQGLCPGSSTTLATDTPFANYNWAPGGNGNSLVIDQPGMYSVTVTDANGCSAQDDIQIASFQAPQVSIQGNLKICANSTTILNAGTGFSAYNWTGAVTSPTLVVGMPGNYSVTVTDANGCSASAGVDVVGHQVSPPPVPLQTDICLGETAFFDAGTSYISYEWPDGSMGATYSTSLPGNYSLTVVDTANCSLTVPFNVAQNALPNISIVAPASLCENDTAALLADATYPLYIWSTGEFTAGIVISTPGDYSLTVEDANGCRNQATTTITAFPSPVVTLSGQTSFCEGTSTVLQATPGFLQYNWNGNGNTDIMQITVDAPGLVELTVTDANGCQASTTAQVTSLAAPDVVITGDSFLCAGATALLLAEGNFSSVSWNGSMASNPLQINQPGIYQAIATGSNGCTATEEITVAQVSLPASQAGPDENLDCQQNSVQLGDLPGTGSQNWIFSWQGPGITASNSPLPQPEVTSPGLYTLIVTDSVSGCLSVPDTVMVEDTRDYPVVQISASDTINCNTLTANINSLGSSGGSGFVYQWLDANAQPIVNENGPSLQVNAPGVFALSIINTLNQCADTANIEVIADFQYPVVDAGISQTLNCYNSFVQLSGTVSDSGSPANSYEINWSTSNGQIVSGTQSLNPAVSSSGVYMLLATNTSTGCSASDSVVVVTDTAAPVAEAADPFLSINCLTSNVTLTVSPESMGAGLEATWLNSLGQPVSSTVSQPGIYILQVTNTQNGCSSTDQVLVSLSDNIPRAEEIQVLSPKCYGDATGVIQIVRIQGGQPPYQYYVDDVLFNGQSGLHNLSAGIYDLEIIDVSGCRWDTAIIVQPGTDPQIELGDDRYVPLGESTDIEVQLNIPDDAVSSQFLLSSDTLLCVDCREYTLSPWRTTAVVGEVVDTNGCIARDVVYIYVDQTRRVYIPNAFTPNGDGVNDRFYIFGDTDVKLIRSLTIHHRWGGKAFEVYNIPPNNPAYGWDGYNLGRPHNTGVFVYMAEIEFIDGSVELFEGDITLLY